MARFLDLPLEVLPLILRHILRPNHLAALCLVDHYFRAFAIPLLYEHAFIYAWQKEAKAKVKKLFRTLSDHPTLASHVKRLVICDFPKALQSADQENVLDICLRGIINCVNLKSCTWTRDGSLTSSVLEALLFCTQLKELEINGSHHGRYDPSILARFSRLRKITLIMPSSAVINTLPCWMRYTGDTLRHLSLICKSPAAVTDTLLEMLAPHISKLEHLYLAGCRKVTERGVLAILAASENGLLSLGLEGISDHFDMKHLSEQCARTGALVHLRSITLAARMAPESIVHAAARRTHWWDTDVLALLAPAPLEQFHMSTIGGEIEPTLSDVFCHAIVKVHGLRLRRFSIHRMPVSLSAIADVCHCCPLLEQLFVVMDQDALDELGPCLAEAHRLRTVHVNRPLLTSGDAPVVSSELILSLVRQCPPTLTHFGSNTRVYQVERVPIVEEDGTITIDVRLSSYESPEVPEQFLVVRM
ncbi:hypothetical protein BKA93DRAFT_793618 [Sparassis latifolia]|uniref:F-box domain-containing protein n=1 Tax=Sparassis crispa TaxID=139825 RepID=A0A401H5V5_9APHY|nr:hypothetical protein SCP_1700980 [Sparassis crispa]GBE89773.1 hypothetical protein SCP_1700980 [Sparassis crispa]